MAFQRVPYTYQILAIWSMNTIFCQNTFYAQVDSSVYSQATAEMLANAFAEYMGTVYRLVFPQNAQLVQAEVRGLNAAEDYQHVSVNDLPVAGAITSEGAPNNVAFAVSRYTGLTGRSARGRVFLPVPQSVLQTNETLVSVPHASLCVDTLNDIAPTLLAVEGAVEVNVSRFSNGARRAEATVRPVTGYNVTDLTVDTMKGRLTN